MSILAVSRIQREHAKACTRIVVKQFHLQQTGPSSKGTAIVLAKEESSLIMIASPQTDERGSLIGPINCSRHGGGGERKKEINLLHIRDKPGSSSIGKQDLTMFSLSLVEFVLCHRHTARSLPKIKETRIMPYVGKTSYTLEIQYVW